MTCGSGFWLLAGGEFVFLTNFVEKRSKIYFVSRFVAEKVGCPLKCVFHNDNNMIRFLPLCKPPVPLPLRSSKET
jgi:hypothetical protein